jgi:serine/threonine-protein kinase
MAEPLLLCELGRGGMGTVFLAAEFGFGGVRKLQVIKRVAPSLLESAEQVRAFVHEARLAAAFHHPNVVQTLGAHADGEGCALRMEFLEGQPLSVLLAADPEREKVGRDVYLLILVEALAGLHYVHEFEDVDGRPLKIVHRDVSPANIFVTYEGEVKLLDFGIAKSSAAAVATGNGVVKGKLPYMAPERFGGGAADRRADVYAAGAVLFQLLTGVRLWQGASDAQVLNALSEGQIPTAASVDPNVPAALDRVCQRALASDPEQRFQSAEDLRAALLAEISTTAIADFRSRLRAGLRDLFAEQRSLFWRRVHEKLEPVERKKRLEADRDLLLSVEAPVSSFAPVVQPSAAVPAPRRRSVTWRAVPRAGRRVFAVALGLCILSAGTCGSTEPERSVTQEFDPSDLAGAGALVTLEFANAPEGARLFVDGARLPEGVTQPSFPRDGALHKVRAEARGYRIEEDVVAFDRPRVKVHLRLADTANLGERR